MKSHLPEQVYLAAPVWVQNLLVSLLGIKEHGNRYGGKHDAFYKNLIKNKYESEDHLNKATTKRLDKILQDALTHVPYYKSLNIQNPVLTEFPLLDRQIVAQQPEQFVSDQYNPGRLMTLYTGGSTAMPVKVYISKDVRRKSYTFWRQFYSNMGFDIGDKKASFVGRMVQKPDNDKPPFWRYNLRDRQLVFSSYHLSEKNIPKYLDKLNRFEPKIIEGYPLTIYRLADYILTHNVKSPPRLAGISTSSESFTNLHRETIEKAFNCKMFDQYGSAESVVFASECAYGKMHIEPEYGLLEVITENGDVKAEGKGELVATTLLNDVMPLIRYRIGDLGEIINEKCICGRNTLILKELVGKVGSVIVNGDKQVPTAAIAIAFEYLEGIKNAQIIQNSADAVVVKLARKPNFNPKSEDFMIWELRKMLGESLKISVEYVDDIPPEANGKYKMVVQNFLRL